MKKKTFLVVTALLVLTGGVSFGDDPADCAKLNLMFQPGGDPSLEPGEPLYEEYVPVLLAYYGIDAFDWCWSQPIRGSLGGVGVKGTWVACGAFDLSLLAPLFPEVSAPFGAGPDLYGNPGILITNKGDIFTMSYGASVYEGADFTWVAFGGITWYGDGTGAFEGAHGWGSDTSKTTPPSFWVRSVGYLCFPD
jgi:hypothetical protein